MPKIKTFVIIDLYRHESHVTFISFQYVYLNMIFSITIPLSGRLLFLLRLQESPELDGSGPWLKWLPCQMRIGISTYR